MAVFKRGAILPLACAAVGVFVGSLVGQLFLDSDENDLMALVPGVRATSLFKPVLGKAYAFNLQDGKFEPASLCALSVQDEVKQQAIPYNLQNEWGLSYNKTIEALGVESETPVLGSLLVQDVQKQWVFQRQTWTESPAMAFEERCEQRIRAKTADPNFQVFLVEAILLEKDAADGTNLVQVSSQPVVFGCEGECPENATTSWVKHIHRVWPSRLKVEWQMVQEN
ncbi:hypothetical protein [Pseudophaeobacter sp.]|uniref:hypothetical protein n=1 Tax=Pseudophaeobacter sp. TaxID=1971739 RepID=UPI0032993920